MLHKSDKTIDLREARDSFQQAPCGNLGGWVRQRWFQPLGIGCRSFLTWNLNLTCVCALHAPSWFPIQPTIHWRHIVSLPRIPAKRVSELIRQAFLILNWRARQREGQQDLLLLRRSLNSWYRVEAGWWSYHSSLHGNDHSNASH